MDTVYIVDEIGLENRIAGSWKKKVHCTFLESLRRRWFAPTAVKRGACSFNANEDPISRKLAAGHVPRGGNEGWSGCPNLVLIRALWCWCACRYRRLGGHVGSRDRLAAVSSRLRRV
jgi:hypothetical protein